MKLRARVRCLAVSLLVEALVGTAPDAAAQTPSGATTTAPRPPTDVVPPKLLSDAKVAYPSGGKGDAMVVLRLTVNADGTVRRAQTGRPFPPTFASRWRFTRRKLRPKHRRSWPRKPTPMHRRSSKRPNPKARRARLRHPPSKK